MSSERSYRLQVQVAGSTWCCYGSRELMKMAIEEWHDWIDDPARSETAILEVNGITNTLDRADLFFICRMEDIQAMETCDFL